MLSLCVHVTSYLQLFSNVPALLGLHSGNKKCAKQAHEVMAIDVTNMQKGSLLRRIAKGGRLLPPGSAWEHRQHRLFSVSLATVDLVLHFK